MTAGIIIAALVVLTASSAALCWALTHGGHALLTDDDRRQWATATRADDGEGEKG